MKFLTNDGIELYFEKSGKGHPCIYLHGGPGYWSKSFQSLSEELLEEDMEMMYLDQRGCGRSEHDTKTNYSLSRLLDDMEELRASLGIKEWYVMGHSFGGILAVNYAHRFPDKTKGVILSNATLNMMDSFGHQIKKGSEILGLEIQELPTRNLASFMDLFYSTLAKLIEKDEYFKFQFLNPENKRKLDKIDEVLNSDPKFQQYVFSSKEYFKDFTSITAKISKPVLVISGKYDNAIGPQHYKTFNFNSSIVRVLDSAHHPYMENQKEFKKAILDFVNK